MRSLSKLAYEWILCEMRLTGRQEVATLEAQAFEHEQKLAYFTKAKQILDEWVRHETAQREREQKRIAEEVMAKVMAAVQDAKFVRGFYWEVAMLIYLRSKKSTWSSASATLKLPLPRSERVSTIKRFCPTASFAKKSMRQDASTWIERHRDQLERAVAPALWPVNFAVKNNLSQRRCEKKFNAKSTDLDARTLNATLMGTALSPREPSASTPPPTFFPMPGHFDPKTKPTST
jgi:hypothetical protein